MDYDIRPLGEQKRIALVAHDLKKGDLLEWAKFNRDVLARHIIVGTGTTGKMLEKTLGIEVIKLQSGPLGGDQQIGAKIAEGEIDFVVFFWDPLAAQPHDPDVKALMRLAVVWNIPMACNRASADFMFSSSLMNEPYERMLPDYETYRQRAILTKGEQEAPGAAEDQSHTGDMPGPDMRGLAAE
ncbi:MAG: methylglyoxal synthase [Hyphomicrobiales bacterium]|nr:MAG: methylglyoxal synthase [Hyphomicrobiales bacterium]